MPKIPTMRRCSDAPPLSFWTQHLGAKHRRGVIRFVRFGHPKWGDVGAVATTYCAFEAIARKISPYLGTKIQGRIAVNGNFRGYG